MNGPVKLIAGCGYLGRRVAQRWQQQGDRVVVLTRSTGRARDWEREGLEPLVGDITRPETLPALPCAATVLFSVGYDSAGGQSRDEVFVRGLDHFLSRLPEPTGRLVHISSTGVYGNGVGDWVTESTACNPETPGGRALLAAENLLSQHEFASRRIILRLAGIYGPGRLPRRRDLSEGNPIAVAADQALNLIHVDDAARAILTVETAGTAPATYNVSDGHPVERQEYLRFLASRLGFPAPVLVPPTAGQEGRGMSRKKVSSDALQALGWQPRYEDYRQGIAQIIASEDTS